MSQDRTTIADIVGMDEVNINIRADVSLGAVVVSIGNQRPLILAPQKAFDVAKGLAESGFHVLCLQALEDDQDT